LRLYLLDTILIPKPIEYLELCLGDIIDKFGRCVIYLEGLLLVRPIQLQCSLETSESHQLIPQVLQPVSQDRQSCLLQLEFLTVRNLSI